MAKKLPQRPNLDHLRRQAKTLLTSLKTGDLDAISTIRDHLPSAAGLTAPQIRELSICLADAQLATARKTGFASWPRLARHVDQLRALEGTWGFEHLEVDGHSMPPTMLQSSRILIDGDRFRTESSDATYEGIFNIDVEAEPHQIDIEFIAGPEAGNHNYGIFRLEGDQLEFCLDLNGKPHPAQFRTAPGRGHAYEKLIRRADNRPESVAGGTPSTGQTPQVMPDSSGFEFVESKTLNRLQGEWAAVNLVLDGQELPKSMLATGHRTAHRNSVKILFAGKLMIDALIRIDEEADPICVDYLNLGGVAPGTIQSGIMKWVGDSFCLIMAPPGAPRPEDFICTAGSGRTLSQWKPRR